MFQIVCNYTIKFGRYGRIFAEQSVAGRDAGAGVPPAASPRPQDGVVGVQVVEGGGGGAGPLVLGHPEGEREEPGEHQGGAKHPEDEGGEEAGGEGHAETEGQG